MIGANRAAYFCVGATLFFAVFCAFILISGTVDALGTASGSAGSGADKTCKWNPTTKKYEDNGCIAEKGKCNDKGKCELQKDSGGAANCKDAAGQTGCGGLNQPGSVQPASQPSTLQPTPSILDNPLPPQPSTIDPTKAFNDSSAYNDPNALTPATENKPIWQRAWDYLTKPQPVPASPGYINGSEDFGAPSGSDAKTLQPVNPLDANDPRNQLVPPPGQQGSTFGPDESGMITGSNEIADASYLDRIEKKIADSAEKFVNWLTAPAEPVYGPTDSGEQLKQSPFPQREVYQDADGMFRYRDTGELASETDVARVPSETSKPFETRPPEELTKPYDDAVDKLRGAREKYVDELKKIEGYQKQAEADAAKLQAMKDKGTQTVPYEGGATKNINDAIRDNNARLERIANAYNDVDGRINGIDDRIDAAAVGKQDAIDRWGALQDGTKPTLASEVNAAAFRALDKMTADLNAQYPDEMTGSVSPEGYNKLQEGLQKVETLREVVAAPPGNRPDIVLQVERFKYSAYFAEAQQNAKELQAEYNRLTALDGLEGGSSPETLRAKASLAAAQEDLKQRTIMAVGVSELSRQYQDLQGAALAAAQGTDSKVLEDIQARMAKIESVIPQLQMGDIAPDPRYAELQKQLQLEAENISKIANASSFQPDGSILPSSDLADAQKRQADLQAELKSINGTLYNRLENLAVGRALEDARVQQVRYEFGNAANAPSLKDPTALKASDWYTLAGISGNQVGHIADRLSDIATNDAVTILQHNPFEFNTGNKFLDFFANQPAGIYESFANVFSLGKLSTDPAQQLGLYTGTEQAIKYGIDGVNVGLTPFLIRDIAAVTVGLGRLGYEGLAARLGTEDLSALEIASAADARLLGENLARAETRVLDSTGLADYGANVAARDLAVQELKQANLGLSVKGDVVDLNTGQTLSFRDAAGRYSEIGSAEADAVAALRTEELRPSVFSKDFYTNLSNDVRNFFAKPTDEQLLANAETRVQSLERMNTELDKRATIVEGNRGKATEQATDTLRSDPKFTPDRQQVRDIARRDAELTSARLKEIEAQKIANNEALVGAREELARLQKLAESRQPSTAPVRDTAERTESAAGRPAASVEPSSLPPTRLQQFAGDVRAYLADRIPTPLQNAWAAARDWYANASLVPRPSGGFARVLNIGALASQLLGTPLPGLAARESTSLGQSASRVVTTQTGREVFSGGRVVIERQISPFDFGAEFREPVAPTVRIGELSDVTTRPVGELRETPPVRNGDSLSPSENAPTALENGAVPREVLPGTQISVDQVTPAPIQSPPTSPFAIVAPALTANPFSNPTDSAAPSTVDFTTGIDIARGLPSNPFLSIDGSTVHIDIPTNVNSRSVSPFSLAIAPGIVLAPIPAAPAPVVNPRNSEDQVAPNGPQVPAAPAPQASRNGSPAPSQIAPTPAANLAPPVPSSIAPVTNQPVLLARRLANWWNNTPQTGANPTPQWIRELIFYATEPYHYYGADQISLNNAILGITSGQHFTLSPDFYKNDKSLGRNTPEYVQGLLDPWRVYLGLPQLYGTLSVSQFKPTVNSGDQQNKQYYKINNFLDNYAKNSTISQTSAEAIKIMVNQVQLFGKKTGTGLSVIENDFGQSGIMGGYTLSLGEDASGKYISYYDNWKLASSDGRGSLEGTSGLVGTPFEIYDRIYYNPDTFEPITDVNLAKATAADTALLASGDFGVGAAQPATTIATLPMQTLSFLPILQAVTQPLTSAVGNIFKILANNVISTPAQGQPAQINANNAFALAKPTDVAQLNQYLVKSPLGLLGGRLEAGMGEAVSIRINPTPNRWNASMGDYGQYIANVLRAAGDPQASYNPSTQRLTLSRGLNNITVTGLLRFATALKDQGITFGLQNAFRDEAAQRAAGSDPAVASDHPLGRAADADLRCNSCKGTQGSSEWKTDFEKRIMKAAITAEVQQIDMYGFGVRDTSLGAKNLVYAVHVGWSEFRNGGIESTGAFANTHRNGYAGAQVGVPGTLSGATAQDPEAQALWKQLNDASRLPKDSASLYAAIQKQDATQLVALLSKQPKPIQPTYASFFRPSSAPKSAYDKAIDLGYNLSGMKDLVIDPDGFARNGTFRMSLIKAAVGLDGLNGVKVGQGGEKYVKFKTPGQGLAADVILTQGYIAIGLNTPRKIAMGGYLASDPDHPVSEADMPKEIVAYLTRLKTGGGEPDVVLDPNNLDQLIRNADARACAEEGQFGFCTGSIRSAADKEEAKKIVARAAVITQLQPEFTPNAIPKGPVAAAQLPQLKPATIAALDGKPTQPAGPQVTESKAKAAADAGVAKKAAEAKAAADAKAAEGAKILADAAAKPSLRDRAKEIAERIDTNEQKAKLANNAKTFTDLGISAKMITNSPWQTTLMSTYGYTGDRSAGSIKTASGVIRNNTLYSVAHKTLDFGTILEVEREAGGKVYIELAVVNERGPYVAGRGLDAVPAFSKAMGLSGDRNADVVEVRFRIVGQLVGSGYSNSIAGFKPEQSKQLIAGLQLGPSAPNLPGERVAEKARETVPKVVEVAKREIGKIAGIARPASPSRSATPDISVVTPVLTRVVQQGVDAGKLPTDLIVSLDNGALRGLSASKPDLTFTFDVRGASAGQSIAKSQWEFARNYSSDASKPEGRIYSKDEYNQFVAQIQKDGGPSLISFDSLPPAARQLVGTTPKSLGGVKLGLSKEAIVKQSAVYFAIQELSGKKVAIGPSMLRPDVNTYSSRQSAHGPLDSNPRSRFTAMDLFIAPEYMDTAIRLANNIGIRGINIYDGTYDQVGPGYKQIHLDMGSVWTGTASRTYSDLKIRTMLLAHAAGQKLSLSDQVVAYINNSKPVPASAQQIVVLQSSILAGKSIVAGLRPSSAEVFTYTLAADDPALAQGVLAAKAPASGTPGNPLSIASLGDYLKAKDIAFTEIKPDTDGSLIVILQNGTQIPVQQTAAATQAITLEPEKNYSLSYLRSLNQPSLKLFLSAANGVSGDRFINGRMLGVVMPIIAEYNTKFGSPPIINGIGRSPAVNSAVGGASNSDHLTGRAIDFKTVDQPSDRVAALISMLRAKNIDLITRTHGQGPHTHASLRRAPTVQELANLRFQTSAQPQYALINPSTNQTIASFTPKDLVARPVVVVAGSGAPSVAPQSPAIAWLTQRGNIIAKNLNTVRSAVGLGGSSAPAQTAQNVPPQTPQPQQVAQPTVVKSEFNTSFTSAPKAGHPVFLSAPAGLNPNQKILKVVYLHGDLESTFPLTIVRQRVSEQVVGSDLNAVAIAPYFGSTVANNVGRFDGQGAFKSFLAESDQKLAALTGLPVSAFSGGPVVIVDYSGGYGPLGAVIARGDANDLVQGIIMMDAGYGVKTTLPAVAAWVAQNPSKFLVSAYTGSTASGNAVLKNLLGNKLTTTAALPAGETMRPGTVAVIKAQGTSLTPHRNFVTTAGVTTGGKEDPITALLKILPASSGAVARAPTPPSSEVAVVKPPAPAPIQAGGALPAARPPTEGQAPTLFEQMYTWWLHSRDVWNEKIMSRLARAPQAPVAQAPTPQVVTPAPTAPAPLPLPTAPAAKPAPTAPAAIPAQKPAAQTPAKGNANTQALQEQITIAQRALEALRAARTASQGSQTQAVAQQARSAAAQLITATDKIAKNPEVSVLSRDALRVQQQSMTTNRGTLEGAVSAGNISGAQRAADRIDSAATQFLTTARSAAQAAASRAQLQATAAKVPGTILVFAGTPANAYDTVTRRFNTVAPVIVSPFGYASSIESAYIASLGARQLRYGENASLEQQVAVARAREMGLEFMMKRYFGISSIAEMPLSPINGYYLSAERADYLEARAERVNLEIQRTQGEIQALTLLPQRFTDPVLRARFDALANQLAAQEKDLADTEAMKTLAYENFLKERAKKFSSRADLLSKIQIRNADLEERIGIGYQNINVKIAQFDLSTKATIVDVQIDRDILKRVDEGTLTLGPVNQSSDALGIFERSLAWVANKINGRQTPIAQAPQEPIGIGPNGEYIYPSLQSYDTGAPQYVPSVAETKPTTPAPATPKIVPPSPAPTISKPAPVPSAKPTTLPNNPVISLQTKVNGVYVTAQRLVNSGDAMAAAGAAKNWSGVQAANASRKVIYNTIRAQLVTAMNDSLTPTAVKEEIAAQLSRADAYNRPLNADARLSELGVFFSGVDAVANRMAVNGLGFKSAVNTAVSLADRLVTDATNEAIANQTLPPETVTGIMGRLTEAKTLLEQAEKDVEVARDAGNLAGVRLAQDRVSKIVNTRIAPAVRELVALPEVLPTNKEIMNTRLVEALGNVAEIDTGLTSFASKSPLEKAKARDDLAATLSVEAQALKQNLTALRGPDALVMLSSIPTNTLPAKIQKEIQDLIAATKEMSAAQKELEDAGNLTDEGAQKTAAIAANVKFQKAFTAHDLAVSNLIAEDFISIELISQIAGAVDIIAGQMTQVNNLLGGGNVFTLAGFKISGVPTNISAQLIGLVLAVQQNTAEINRGLADAVRAKFKLGGISTGDLKFSGVAPTPSSNLDTAIVVSGGGVAVSGTGFLLSKYGGAILAAIKNGLQATIARITPAPRAQVIPANVGVKNPAGITKLVSQLGTTPANPTPNPATNPQPAPTSPAATKPGTSAPTPAAPVPAKSPTSPIRRIASQMKSSAENILNKFKTGTNAAGAGTPPVQLELPLEGGSTNTKTSARTSYVRNAWDACKRYPIICGGLIVAGIGTPLALLVTDWDSSPPATAKPEAETATPPGASPDASKLPPGTPDPNAGKNAPNPGAAKTGPTGNGSDASKDGKSASGGGAGGLGNLLQNALKALAPILPQLWNSLFGPKPPETPKPVVPSVTLTAKPTSVDSGKTAQLSWSGENIANCTIYGPGNSTLTSGGVSGTVATPALKRSKEFGIACSGSDGTSITSATVTVKVNGDSQTPISVVFPDGSSSGSSLSTPQQGTQGTPNGQGTTQNQGTGGTPNVGTNGGTNEAPVTPPVTGHDDKGNNVSPYCDPGLPMDAFVQCLCRLDPTGCKPWKK